MNPLPLLCTLLALAFAALAAPLSAQDDPQVPAGSEAYVYEVEALNPDLSVPGEPLELDTPQALFESFLTAAEQDEWRRAASALDMTDLPPPAEARSPEELAAMMYAIIHRSVELDWAALPDRPDAVETRASNKDPMSGAERRHMTIARLQLDSGRTVPLSISRLQEPDGEPVWMFSRQTVGNLPALYARHGPTAFERSLPGFLRKQAFWTLAWWEVVAIPLVLLVALVAAALTYRVIGNWEQRLGDEERVIDNILKAVQLPATLLALAGSFTVMRNTLFTFSGAVEDILGPLQLTLIVMAIGAAILSVIEAILDFATDRNVYEIEKPQNEASRDFYTHVSAIRRIVIVLIILAGIGIILVQSSLTQTLGFSLLASAGVIGLIIAFAARRVLGNIMASLQIAFARTARIGDAVEYEGKWCYVEKIGFTHLRLRTWDERRIMAPVAEFVGSSFENWTKQDPSLTMRVPLYLDHRADIPRLRKEFERIVAEDDDVIDKDYAKLQVIEHTPQTMVARCVFRAVDPKVGWVVHCRVREEMLAAAARLDAAAGNEPSPAYLPREREVRMDVAVEEATD